MSNTVSNFDQICINPVRAVDLYDFCDLLMEATHWFEHNGESLWNRSQLSPHALLSKYRLEDLFLAYHQGEAIGALIMSCDSGWPELDDCNRKDSLFVHKFVVKPCYRGTGLSKIILRWACQHCEAHNAEHLILMCNCNNINLRNHWVSLGFTEIETFTCNATHKIRRDYVVSVKHFQVDHFENEPQEVELGVCNA